jgi:SAM-dependent methyltransferase
MVDCPEQSERESMSLFDSWYLSTLGKELADLEEKCLERMLRDTFGYYLLQVGGASCLAETVRMSRIRQRIYLPARIVHESLGCQVVATPDRLPIAADSVDVVVLPHTLEFAHDARQVLREAERVLIAEGRLVVIGFNALSMWGAWRLVRRGRGRVPWCGRFLTPFRVCDWLSLLGFDIEMREMMMFRPPWRRALLQQLSFLDTLGPRLWPALGGVFAIRAVKRVPTLTPVRPRWRKRHPVLAGGAVEPTARRSTAEGNGFSGSAEREHV